MHNLTTLAQSMGPFILVPAIFLIVGICMWLTMVWGLLTGGPRALDEPGAPYLYDRVYYLLFIVALVGWSVALLSAVDGNLNDGSPRGFLAGWGILALGMGAVFAFRSDMMLRGSLYQSKHGFWLTRFYHALQAGQIQRQGTTFRKAIGGIFVLVGLGVTALTYSTVPDAFRSAWAGALSLVHFLAN